MDTKHKKAVALQYEKARQGAPKVTAKGSGTIAEQIIKKAGEFDVPLFMNRELVDSLVHLDIDTELPPQLYEATVEVVIWLMRCEQQRAAQS